MWFNLRGDQRLSRCATEGCSGQPTFRLEAYGVGSNYCSGCRDKIDPYSTCEKPADSARLGDKAQGDVG
jgi:hypothetical protein